MHKLFLVITLISALFFAVSCDSGVKFNNPNDINSDAYNPESGENETNDEDIDQTDSDPTDSESTDTEPDNPDSIPEQPDNGDSEPDDTDTDDSGDSTPADSDTSDSTDDSDSAPDNSDSTPDDDTDTADFTNDSGDSEPDEDTNTTTVDTCVPNPCTDVLHSTGNCAAEGNGYACECQTHYSWNGSVCKADKQVTDCIGKPENSSWNSATSITQTWDGNEWYPPATGTYNETPSESECRYKCASGYNWNGSGCTSGGGSSLPECSASSGTPCKDSSSGLIWSARASSTYTWSNAVSYCNNLTEGGYSDWHLPTIDELRTLLIADRVKNNCQVSETNGCLSSSCWSCSTCTQTGTQSSSGTSCSSWGTSYSDGRYSKLGDGAVYLWSSSTASVNTGYAWRVHFGYGFVGHYHEDYNNGDVRCVRK